jgi:hypothetical protein
MKEQSNIRNLSNKMQQPTQSLEQNNKKESDTDSIRYGTHICAKCGTQKSSRGITNHERFCKGGIPDDL